MTFPKPELTEWLPPLCIRAIVAANSSTSASAPAPASADVPEQDVSTQAEDETSRIIQSVQRENDDRLQAMSHDERMAEKQELLGKFGGGLLDVLRKRREAREGKGVLPLPASEGRGEGEQSPASEDSKGAPIYRHLTRTVAGACI